MAREFTYTVDPDFDYTIDEKGNTFYALRKIDWGNKGEFKLDLRKYYASESGETMSKGVSLSEEGADELARVLLETGYGNDSEIAGTIINSRIGVVARIAREIENNPELLESIDSSDINFDNEEENYYDPEELIA